MPLEPLTPNTVLLVLLLNELNEISESDFNQSLNRFVIDRILVFNILYNPSFFQNKTVWNTYNEFLSDLNKEARNPLLLRLINEKV